MQQIRAACRGLLQHFIDLDRRSDSEICCSFRLYSVAFKGEIAIEHMNAPLQDAQVQCLHLGVGQHCILRYIVCVFNG